MAGSRDVDRFDDAALGASEKSARFVGPASQCTCFKPRAAAFGLALAVKPGSSMILGGLGNQILFASAADPPMAVVIKSVYFDHLRNFGFLICSMPRAI
jgi:hypothetical protein